MNKSQRKLIIIDLIKHKNEAKKSNVLSDVLTSVNYIVAIHKDWLKTVKEAVKTGNFKDIDGIDFNEFYHDFENIIENVYFEAKDKYYSLHFDKYGFNAY
jgi:hypothetical protein